MPDRNTSRLRSGSVLTARISELNGQNPLIKYSQYFVYVRPKFEDARYTNQFINLRKGDSVTVRISRLEKGCNGRWICETFLYNNSERKHNGCKIYKSDRAQNFEYLNFEHEIQARFGNTLPSREQMAELRRKWEGPKFL